MKSPRKPLPGHELSAKFPQVAKLWDYNANDGLTPDDVSYGSDYDANWICDVDPNHKWNARVSMMTINRGKARSCPYCSKTKIFPGQTDLATLRPTLVLQWHPTKNGDLRPSDVGVCSSKRVWWKCDFCGYEWKSTVASRADKRRNWFVGCPKCNLTSSTSFPEQAILFYLQRDCNFEILNRQKFDLNGKSYEFDIYIPSLKTAIEYDGGYWHTHRKHIDKKDISEQLKITLITIFAKDPNHDTDISDSYDYLISETTDELNQLILTLEQKLGIIPSGIIDIKSDELSIYAQYKHAYFQQSVGHLYPELVKEWDYEKNGELTPFMFLPGAKANVWWKCANGHSWKARISSRCLDNANCWTCVVEKSKKPPCLENTLAYLYPETAQYWNYEKNAPLTPNDVYGQSGQMAWWIDEHGREWTSKIAIEVTRTKHHVPYDIGRMQNVVKGENTLDITHPEIAAMWHPTKNGNLYPDDVIAKSTHSVWWLDPTCGHEWKQTIWYVVNSVPFCPCHLTRTKTLISGYNDLATKRPDLMDLWSPRNIGLPSDYIYSTKQKAYWICKNGVEWEQLISTRARSQNACPCQGTRKLPPCESNGVCPRS